MDELQRSLSLLSPDIVKGRYKAVLDRCRFLEWAAPRMMQELVTLWRVLWNWRKPEMRLGPGSLVTAKREGRMA